MKIKNFQESKNGVNDNPKSKRPSPTKGMGQKKKPILLELKTGYRILYSANSIGLSKITKAFGVPEEILKNGLKND
jgi:hypothetical protein